MLENNVILPPKTIGIIGGGQLGRMMAIAARYMGYKIAVLDPTPNCPTGQIADKQIVAPYDDMDAIKELTAISDVITYEFENVDLDAARFIEAAGKLPQGALALEITQNREKEKQLMKRAGLPIPAFRVVTNGKECEAALEDFALPAVIKTCSGGYDGKGQIKLNTKEDLPKAIDFADKNGHCIIEEWVTFDREISVIFARTAAGHIEFFPIAENEHRDHILYKTTVPANISEAIRTQAYEAARVLADKMNIVGTFAIEMFVKDNDIYLNEMAPRPHNSGHYTIEGCNVSQFTQHIRAICGLQIPAIELLQPSIMLNILGEEMEAVLTIMPKEKDGFIHLYGKDEAKTKRKMGHVTFIGETKEAVEKKVQPFEAVLA